GPALRRGGALVAGGCALGRGGRALVQRHRRRGGSLQGRAAYQPPDRGPQEVPWRGAMVLRRGIYGDLPAPRGLAAPGGGQAGMSWNIGAGLEGKGVIVTGAAGGIGREVALAFAKAGSHVAACDINEKGVSEVVADIDDAGGGGVAAAREGGRPLPLPADLRQVAGHEGLIARVQETFGRVDVLANTAAILIRRGNIDEVTEEDWDLQHDINLKAG